MSRNYKHGDTVPSEKLCKRLNELSEAVTQGPEAVAREFDMRIPAELDRDADLVLSQAVILITALEDQLAAEREKVRVLEGLLIDLNTVWGKSRYNRSKKHGSPNHAHAIPGIWDSDNGALAGKPCAECAVYDRAREIVANLQATAQEEKNG